MMRSRLIGRSMQASDAENPVTTCMPLDYAKQMIHEMADEVVREGSSGTIGIEIPVKNGVLGKVKRLQILFQD